MTISVSTPSLGVATVVICIDKKLLSFCHTHTSIGDSAADYNIQNKDMVLIWAFGQVYPEYNHQMLNLPQHRINVFSLLMS